MKIGLVCPYNIYKGGGVRECVLAIQHELIARGHNAKIIAPLPREASGKPPDGVIFIGGATDFKSPFGTTAQVSVTINNDAVDEVLRHEKFDILHFHEPWVPIVSRQILSRSTSKNIATFHAKLPETVMSRTIERVITPYTKSIIKYLDVLTAVSDSAAAYAGTLTNKPVKIIPNGIDLKEYTQEPAPKSSNKRKHILYIGRLEKRKGVKYLLYAFAQLLEKRPDAKLTLAGDGADREKLEALVQTHGIKNVRFLGFVTQKQKLKLLRTCDLMVSPALYGESFGIVLLEAMASKLPVIAGDNPGYRDVMKETGRLSIINPKQADEFARRMQLFLEDDGVRDLWLGWATKYVEQFSYPNVVDQYEALYKEVL